MEPFHEKKMNVSYTGDSAAMVGSLADVPCRCDARDPVADDDDMLHAVLPKNDAVIVI